MLPANNSFIILISPLFLKNLFKVNVIIFICLVLSIISCIPQKKVIYLQNTKDHAENVFSHTKNQYKIRPHDNLLITVSSINPQVTEFFNLKQDVSKSGLNTYLVNHHGYIYMPVLDSFMVKDMTVLEIQASIQKSIREHVTDATVIVKLGNFNVAVVGEVGNPGVHSFEGDELSILEALGMAGDISDFGNKTKVILIRKEGDASKFVELDLTRRNIVSSEYYYLKPNDIIYVEPLKAKNYKLNAGQLTLLVGLSSFILLILNLLKN